MDKDDEYRKHAAHAQAMADRTQSDYDKSSWLQIAQGWLSMIRKPKQTELEKFDDNTKVRGTGQDDSESSH
jgi:hypothetical protein